MVYYDKTSKQFYDGGAIPAPINALEITPEAHDFYNQNRDNYTIDLDKLDETITLDNIKAIAVDVESFKRYKIKELSAACENAITNEFYSEITGERVHYGYDLTDQQNWGNLYNVVQLAAAGVQSVIDQLSAMGYEPGKVNIKGIDSAPFEAVTYEQYIAFYLEGIAHVTHMRFGVYAPLKARVEQAETFDEVDSIVWPNG